MSRNGSGTYSLVSGNPVVSGQTIESTWANNTLTDIASALTQSISKDGQTPYTGNQPMGGSILTGLGAGSASGNSVRYEQVLLITGGTLTGNLLFTDATYDIGASGATRPRDVYLSRLLDLSGAAAGQIKFPATQNASANANTLDDYEEGTWTPVPTYAAGAASNVTIHGATYTKIGRLVNFNCYVSFRIGTGSGTFSITGLPFAAGALTAVAISALDRVDTVANTPMFCQISSADIFFYTKIYDGTNSVMVASSDTQFNASASDMTIVVSGTYSV